MAYIRQPTPATKDSFGTVRIGKHLTTSTDGSISVDVDSIVYCGEWKPKLISGPDGGNIKIKNFHSYYTKIARLVHAFFDLQVEDMGRGSPSSYVMLEGLPHISMKSNGYCGSLIISNFQNLDSKTGTVSGSVLPGSYACDLWLVDEITYSTQRMEFGDIDKRTRLQGTIIYTAEDD